MPHSRRARPGASAVELLVSIAIGGVVAAAVATAAIREADGRTSRQDDLQMQQAVALTLNQFSVDVRAGNGLLSASPTFFKLRHAAAGNTYTYVAYRLQGGRLQRGTAATRDAEPGDWRDLLDPERFVVAGGTFGYYMLGNKNGQTASTMRRIEINGFDLRARRGNLPVRTPHISAVMREAANARDFQTTCAPEVIGHWNGATAWGSGSVHITFCATNATDRTITVDAFDGDWRSGTAADPLEAIHLENGPVVWGQGQTSYLKKTAARKFAEPLTFAPGQTRRLRLHFHQLEAKIDVIALKLYEPTDTARANPYLITASID